MKPVAKKENLFFFAALFAIMLAGDAIWWQAKQLGDDFENSDAALYPAVRSDIRDADLLGQSIDRTASESEQEIQLLKDLGE